MTTTTTDPATPPPGGAFAPALGAQAAPTAARPFRLTRWFGGVALVLIATVALLGAWLLDWAVGERMLQQEGELTRDFVQSVVAVEKPLQAYFAGQPGTDGADLEEAFEHFARMPDVLRSNVYDAQRRVLWSSDETLRGRRFVDNHELDHALAGRVVVERRTDEERRHGKAEYERLQQPGELFVEIYVPVRDVDSGRVVGAIEFYKNPRGLQASLAGIRTGIAWVALAFAALLFGALFGLVRRADRLIGSQQRRLVDQESFAVVGQMASVVAHGIRNPLAAMRSSAELIQDSRDAATADAARDIVEQADRLGSWVRELLTYTRLPEAGTPPQPLALAPLVRSCVQDFARDLERRRVRVHDTLADDLPPVQGDALAIGHVLRSLVANALDAVADGGRIALSAVHVPQRATLTLAVQDDGPGLSPEQLERVGRPFFTTKAQGMGVGLALARQVVQRHGGELSIESERGAGTVVSITLKVAR